MEPERPSDERPVWARRVRRERQARGWSQHRAVQALRAHAGRHGLPSDATLVRNWKRWESGEVEPDAFYKPLIAKTFGTVTAALFATPRPDIDAEILAGTGLDTLEILARIRASAVSPATIDALRIAAERLACDYSRVPSDELLAEGRAWLCRIVGLRDARMTLKQHRDVMALAGRVALLVGCVEYDMGDERVAEATRRAAHQMGMDSGDLDVVGWAHEMRAWYALTLGHYQSAISAAAAGLEIVGPTHDVVVQLAAHQAKAWARIGDRREVEAALGRGREVLESLPCPDNLDNHFVVDPSKWDFYTMDCYRHIGENRLAEVYAEAVVRSSRAFSGATRHPMRVAEAHVTLGVVAARNGDLESALAEGSLALAGARRSIPSLVMHTRELAEVLARQFPGERAVADYGEQLRALIRRTD